MHKVNYVIAVILACLSVVVLVTMRNSKLREKSVMWYLYHLIALTVLVIVLHTVALFADMPESEGTCLFVIYGLEYLFMAFALSIILANIEIFFTIVLPFESWRTKNFMRFMISVLGGWIVVCLIVGHLIIDNNDARRDGNYCYYSKSKTIRNIRFALRSVLPAGVGFLFTLTSITIYVLKRYRAIKTNSSETLKEIVFSSEKDEASWIRVAACLNFLFVLRVVVWGLLKIRSLHLDYEKNIYAIVTLIAIHVQSLNLLPVAMLSIPEVREDIKRMCMTLLKFITRGRLGSQDDRETLTVSFGNINATDDQ